MPIRTFAQKLMASSLGLLLVSCSINQPIITAQGPTGPQDLARYVLIIQDTPDGRVTHDWKPVKDVDLMKFQYTLSTMNSNRGIVHVSSTELDRYCEGRQEQCEQDCLSSSRPMRVGHWKYENVKIQPWREAKMWWCPEHCRKQADMCKRRMGTWAEEYAAEFNAIEPAVDWIKNHREEIIVGSIIVIAGVAFVAASGGGALLLMPLVFVAQFPPGLPTPPSIAEATR